MKRKFASESGETSSGIRSLCPTRWTVKAASIQSILENYQFLIENLEEDLRVSKSMPTEMKSRINGIITIMKKFSTFFGFKLAHFLLQHTDNLAQKLQCPKLNAAQGFDMAMLTVRQKMTIKVFPNFLLVWLILQMF